MTIDKLPSGKYRIRQFVNGKRRTITVDHKPTQSEAVKLIANNLNNFIVDASKDHFEKSCMAYIETKSNVLSPSTIRRYNQYVKSMPDSFLNAITGKITRTMVQSEVNRYSVGHAPKTTINYIRFITAVLNYFGNPIDKITLPQEQESDLYIPNKDEVSAVFSAIKNSRYEIAIKLAACGLRRSEICALQPSDLNGVKLHINKALVQDSEGNWVIKTPKTKKSKRIIDIPEELADLIRERGVIYEGRPGSIRDYLAKIEKELNLEHFSPHKLRHFYASYLHQLGYADIFIQDTAGWESNSVLKKVYTHSLELDKAKQSIASDLGALM